MGTLVPLILFAYLLIARFSFGVFRKLDGSYGGDETFYGGLATFWPVAWVALILWYIGKLLVRVVFKPMWHLSEWAIKVGDALGKKVYSWDPD